MKKVCILKGSARKNGNTNSLVNAVEGELTALGCSCVGFDLNEMDIRPCRGCRACQYVLTGFGCPQKDDMHLVFDEIMASDIILFATPVYSWYCTPPMKAAMDRLVYGMNKYFGDEKGPALWAGKKLALVATCGYKPQAGADLLDEGFRRFCKHSQLVYLGMLCERNLGYDVEFMTAEKAEHAKSFAGLVAGCEAQALPL